MWRQAVSYTHLDVYKRQALVRINATRLLYIARTSGIWLIAFLCFILSALFVLAVYYQIEFAQAVLFLLVPMTILAAMSIRVASLIETDTANGEVLDRRLMRLRTCLLYTSRCV